MRVFLICFCFIIAAQPAIILSAKSSEIPRAGKAMELEAAISNFTELVAPKLYVSRDGVPFEIPMKLKLRDVNNKLIYNAVVPSPKFQLLAIAYLVASGDRVTKSNQLKITRSCKPKTSLTSAKELEIVGQENLEKLNQLILDDLEVYQSLIRQVEQLQVILKD